MNPKSERTTNRASSSAWLLCGLTICTATIGVVAWWSQGAPQPLTTVIDRFGWGWLLPATYSILAATIISRQPRNRVGWLMMLTGIASVSYGSFLAAPRSELTPGLWLLLWFDNWSWIPLLDHASKVVFGWAVGERADRSLALAAWRAARKTLGRMGFTVEKMIVHHDQDSVYTSYDWTGQLLLNDGVHISYALDGAKDNPFIEAFFSRFKSENRSLFWDAPTIDVLIRVVNARIDYYNRVRRHSSLGNTAPMVFLQNWLDVKEQVVSETANVPGDHTIT